MCTIMGYMIIRNVVKYVILLKRYKEFRIAWFYALAIFIIGLRVTE